MSNTTQENEHVMFNIFQEYNPKIKNKADNKTQNTNPKSMPHASNAQIIMFSFFNK